MTLISLPARGKCIHILGTGPKRDPERGHLHVVLTELCGSGSHLLAPVRSMTSKTDRTCILGVGDHSFIKHPSFISYAEMDIWPESKLQQKIGEGNISFKTDMDPKIFALICMGVTQSRLTSAKNKKYYLAQTARSSQSGQQPNLQGSTSNAPT